MTRPEPAAAAPRDKPVISDPDSLLRPFTLSLDSMASSVIPPGTKGLPRGLSGQSRRGIGARRLNVLAGDVPLPACVLSREAVSHNRAVMREFTERMGVQLAPHGKSTMAPQLFAEQSADGAWAMTAATPAHLFAYRNVEVSRILYANQLIDSSAIRFVLEELERDPGFEFLCLVDSMACVDVLLEAMRGTPRPPGRPIDVLIEIGVSGARTGVRGKDQALALGRHLSSLAPWLRLRGVEAFEGIVPVGTGAGLQAVEQLLDTVSEVALTLAAEGAFAAHRPIVSVGGSAYFGTVATRLRALPVPVQVVLRSGCYLTHDHGMYASAQDIETRAGRLRLQAPFRPAIEVWANVQSRPEPALAIAALGKRDISYDVDMPIPVKWAPRGGREALPLATGFRVESLNDQHARVRLPDGHPIEVGDRIGFGCSHPCTTFDKWRFLLMVDAGYNVLDVIETVF
jgi:D-serine dehydratase